MSGKAGRVYCIHSTRVLYCNSYCVVVMCVVLQDKLVLSQQEVQQRVQQREKELKELQQAVKSFKVSIRISTTVAVLLGDTWIGQVDSLYAGRLLSLEGHLDLFICFSFFMSFPLSLSFSPLPYSLSSLLLSPLSLSPSLSPALWPGSSGGQ